MRKKNSIDALVENLQTDFSKISNFHLTQTDSLGKKLFNFVVRLAAEFQAFQNLFVQYYLPASLKSVQDFKRELKHSKYKSSFKLTEEEYMENYYETVRLGYVGAYHKYESFLKNVVPLMDEFFEELDFEDDFLPMNEYLKKEFDLELNKTIYNFKITKKINWISNCVKHYDGYPIKEPRPKSISNLDETKKIQIDSKEFKADMQDLIKHNQIILSALFYVGFHQVFGMKFESLKSQLKPENRKHNKVVIERALLKVSIQGMFNAEKNVA
ncbi:hypothetical protein [Maribacter sp. 2210JD10-5]|uniref:hypothetical protein n=1 Tax=Maribacter sp. 2210JD10-5 TaxID=3386272 RepID=UPI0039BD6D01